MDSFYSKIAAEAEDDWDTPATKAGAASRKSRVGVDMDDLLDDFDFSDKPKPKVEPPALSTLDTSFDSLKLTVEAKPLVSSSFNESHSTTSASLGPPVSRPTATQRNSKRNILDSLLAVDSAGREGDDYDSKMSKQKTEINMDESFEIKAGPMSGSSRRSVRFSENLEDSPFDLAAGNNDTGSKSQQGGGGRGGNGGKDGVSTNSRPQTAPSGRSRGGAGPAGWSDLGDIDFDWSPKATGPKGVETTTCNISFDGGLDLDGTITEKQVLNNKADQDDSMFKIGGGDNTPRRSIIARTSKDRSPSTESRRSPSTNLSSNVPTYGTSQLDSQQSSQIVKQLQTEIEGLKGLLKITQKYHKEEIKLLESSHASKTKLLEENSTRRENHLKDELDFSVTQCRDRITQMEKYHEASRGDLCSTVSSVKGDAAKTIETLRNEHVAELDLLAERHARALASLREAETNEARVLAEMQPTATALQELLAQLLTVTNEVKQVEQEQHAAATQRLAKFDRREEVLRLAEERLCVRERESEKAHQLLTEEVAKLEVQLKEQGKALTDDRWMLKQEQARLTKLQITLEEDRRALMEQATRERHELQQLMANFFSEHRETQTRLTAERNTIAEQQQKLRNDQLCWRQRQEEDETKINKMKEELDCAKETFQLERHALDERMHQLQLNEVKLTETQRHLDLIRNNLLSKETELVERSASLDKRDEELTTRTGMINGTQAAVAEVDAKCRRLMEEQTNARSHLEVRFKELDDLEKRLVDDQTNLAKREEHFAKKIRMERKLVCSRCKQVVKKIPVSGRTTSARFSQADFDEEGTRWAKARSPEIDTGLTLEAEPETVKLIGDMSNQQTRSRMLEQLRQELAKDNEFLEEERIYLSGLRHAPYA